MPATVPQPVRVIPRASHMFAQRQARPEPRQIAPLRQRGMNTTGSGFALGSSNGGLYGDFRGAWGDVNMDLRTQLPVMRALSRRLARDNEYARAYRRALVNNVLGNEGMHFQMKVRDPELVVNGKKTGGDLDTFANKVIEDARARFERKENYTVSRDLSREDAQKLYLLCCSDDGETFVRTVRGFDNPFQYATQLIPPELIDTNFNETLPNGGRIIMGIEVDAWGARVAYHVSRPNPGVVNTYGYYAGAPRERVPAAEVIHLFVKEFPGQMRGVPWLQAAAQKLHMLGAYEEAAIINARVGATKMGFFKKSTPTGFGMEELAGKSVEELEEAYPGWGWNNGGITETPMPGEWTELPMNVEPVPWTPNYPEAQFDAFVKAVLRSVAGAMGISYATLSNDLSQNSFSSSRVGLNEEREQWKMLQTWFTENFCQPEFEGWLYMSLATQQILLPPEKIDKFNTPIWSGRRWPDVNPLQDNQAKQLALGMRLTTHSAEAQKLGLDFEELVKVAAEDDKLLKEAGLTAGEDAPMGANQPAPPPQDLEGDGTGA